jgi:ketosteroid isomerase-like protein
MYHAIVAARVRSLWRRVGSGDFAAAVDMADPALRFEFVGDTALSARLTGREQFAAWFRRLGDVFPDIRLTPVDIAVAGPPWNTRVAVRLDIEATLDDGEPYRNQAVQWIRLRWGRMVDDWVLEDTLRLSQAYDRQVQARAS